MNMREAKEEEKAVEFSSKNKEDANQVTGNLPVPIENGRSASLSIRNGA
jgi:hypothetical protein